MRAISLIFVLLIMLVTVGCVTATPARKEAENEMVKRYEQAYENENARAEAYDKALTHAVEKRLGTELNIAVADRVEKGKIDPVKYPPGDVAAEISRLYAVEQSKRTQFHVAQDKFRTIKVQNESANLKGARDIYSALKRADVAPPINLTAAIDGALGAPTTVKATLIPEP